MIIPAGVMERDQYLSRVRARMDKIAATNNISIGPSKKPIEFRLKDGKGKSAQPVLDRIGDRVKLVPKWHSLADRKRTSDAFPSTASLPSSFQHKLDNEEDILNSYWGWVGVIEPEYDLLESWTMLDTESFYEQSISRKLSLAFRNGVEITGESDENVKYVKRRIQQISLMMRQSFLGQFLKDVLFNLYVCSNCFVLKIRDKNASGGYANEKNDNKEPIASYKIIPPGTIFPYLDGKGRISHWRRFFGTGKPYRDYSPEDIIHFKWDTKPGHLFGTPRSVRVRDDIFALRRLEENVELLLVHHLFPLFHVTVGSDEHLAQITESGMSEVDIARFEIQNMPKEGVYVSDHRHKIEVVGASKEGVDPTPMIEHYKKRIFTGLGVSGIDLGEADSGNRATAENVSQNLKDSIKADLDQFGFMVSYAIFRDLFAESNSALSVQNALADVKVEWHEIDVDTQIKKETHAINAFNNHALTQTEVRKVFKKGALPESGTERKDTHFQRHMVGMEKVRHQNSKDLTAIQHEHDEGMAKLSHKHAKEQAAASGTGPTKKTTVKHSKSASGTTTRSKTVEEPVKSGAAKTVATKTQPENQHGKNLDPHKARSSQDPSLLTSVFDELIALDPNDWSAEVSAKVDSMFPGPDMLSVRECLKSYARLSSDADLLWANLRTWALNPIPGDEIAA